MIVALALLVQGTEPPDYKHWASCKPGSWVCMRVETKTPEFTVMQEATIRLLRIEKEAALVEVIQRSYAGEYLVSAQVTEKSIPARIDAGFGVVKEADEIVEVAGRKLKCRRLDVERDVGGTPFEMTFWVSPEVPGGAVKSEGGPAGEEAPSNRMRVLEWRREGAAGVDEVSTRAEAEAALKKVEDTLAGARTLRFEYAQTFRGTTSRGRFAKEGERLLFTFTQPRARGGPLTHTRVSDGKEFAFLMNGRRTPATHKAHAGLGANALALLLYAEPTSLDPWAEVEEGAPPREKAERRDWRVRGREKVAERNALVLEFLTGKDHVTLWVDAERFVPLQRRKIVADGDPVSLRTEEAYSGFVFNEPVDPATFILPKE